MPNQVNQILFDELQRDFQNMGSCVVVDVGPVNPKQDIEIRARLRETGVSYKVVRNRLALRAFAGVGLDMAEAMKGRCGIAVAEEEGAIAAAKALRDWIKKNKNSPIAIKGGVIEGATFVGAAFPALHVHHLKSVQGNDKLVHTSYIMSSLHIERVLLGCL